MTNNQESPQEKNHHSDEDKFLEEEEVTGEDIEIIEGDDIEILEDDENEAEFLGLDNFDSVEDLITLKEHTKPVFCCAIHPSLRIFVTGGLDDTAYIYSFFESSSSGQEEKKTEKVDGFNDTVIGVCFSYDGKYLAIGDMTGEIKVMKISVDKFTLVWEHSTGGDICWLKWHTKTNALIIGSENGTIYLGHISTRNFKIFPGNGQKCETADISYDGVKLLTGYDDGIVKLWDLKTSKIIMEVNSSSPLHNEGSIYSVSCDPNRSFYVSGSADGKILFMNDSGPVLSQSQGGDSIEVVAFCPDNNFKVAASATINGQIAIWDTIKHICRQTIELPGENISVLKWLPNQMLICGTSHGNIYVYDARNGENKIKLRVHGDVIHDIAYDDKEKYVITTSEDCTAQIFKINL